MRENRLVRGGRRIGRRYRVDPVFEISDQQRGVEKWANAGTRGFTQGSKELLYHYLLRMSKMFLVAR